MRSRPNVSPLQAAEAPPDIAVLCESWTRSLLSGHKSPKTIETYTAGVTLLDAFLASRGMPRAVAHLKREHIEAFIVDLLERFRPATASNHYRALVQFFKWLVEEGEIKGSPMSRMKPPIVSEEPPTVLTDFAQNVAMVLGKGRRRRVVAFGNRTAKALDRYLRSRSRHRDADTPALWLGHAGPMTTNGIAQVVRRRGRNAGIGRLHPHLFRHGFAHEWLS